MVTFAGVCLFVGFLKPVSLPNLESGRSPGLKRELVFSSSEHRFSYYSNSATEVYGILQMFPDLYSEGFVTQTLIVLQTFQEPFFGS